MCRDHFPGVPFPLIAEPTWESLWNAIETLQGVPKARSRGDQAEGLGGPRIDVAWKRIDRIFCPRREGVGVDEQHRAVEVISEYQHLDGTRLFTTHQNFT